MEDIRKTNYSKKLDRRAKFSSVIQFFQKHWLKIVLVGLLLCFIFFPETFGSVVGEWFNKLVTAFIENLTF